MLIQLIKKELLQEIRGRESVLSMTVFGVAVILLFAFAFNAAPVEFQKFLPGLIWMTYFFTAVLGLLRSFSAEREMDAFALLLSSPVDRSLIYLAKVTAFWIFLCIVQLITMPLFSLFLKMDFGGGLLKILPLFMLINAAISAVGILIAGMGIRTQMGEILVPLLLFPLLTPVLISAVKSTRFVISGAEFSSFNFWIMLLATFAVVFTLAGILIFDSLSEE